ncbi:uncharacterized protein LOC112347291 isoform X1 [Selaginella moellendorffii]|uniref:uncharacterized protein LOC112347291 isoform X1 n=1 Tax=Selaginella moellendorffii TaxID=88036 RepID=UPI000D1CEF87|nr:uncharacterized protein LOC112347291 isoform X1 [Selaginella moellendorffii]|eukprot:XP_024533732.1 uncharacterized protein LOC112347291 isoform X1 [Selaginella moellendorffii]
MIYIYISQSSPILAVRTLATEMSSTYVFLLRRRFFTPFGAQCCTGHRLFVAVSSGGFRHCSWEFFHCSSRRKRSTLILCKSINTLSSTTRSSVWIKLKQSSNSSPVKARCR